MIASSKTEHQNTTFIKSIRDLCSSSNPEVDFEKLVSEIEKQNQVFGEENDEGALEIIPSAIRQSIAFLTVGRLTPNFFAKEISVPIK